MNILVFASEFAPYNVTGTFRTLNFVNCLADLGFTIHVVTLTESCANQIFGVSQIDAALTSDNPSIIIHRVINDRMFNQYGRAASYFRSRLDTGGDFLRHMSKLVDSITFSAIYATQPHAATVLIARDAASLFRLKLILDMRDTWSAWAIAPFKTRLHYWLVKSAERRLFQQASHIVTVTDEVREIFVRDHGEHLRSKVSIIPNSFVRPLPPTVYYPGFRSKELITIGYVGSFYFRPDLNFEMKRKWYRRKGLKKFEYYSSKEDWLYRSPYFFLSALKLILLEHPELSGRVKVEFIGQRHNWLVDMVEGMGLTSMCIFNGFLAKEALDKKILGFDYLLATSEKVINGRHFCLPSKLFEYISYGKPILGFVTKGSQMDFIEKSRAGRVFNPDELEVAAAQLLETLYHQGVSVIDQEYLENFSLSRNCKTLSKIIWDCAVSSTEAPVLASWKQ